MLALRVKGERLSSRAITGLLIGFAGIVLLVWPDLAGGGASGRQFALGMVALQSLAGYAAYIYALKYLPVSVVSLYAYANPVIAVLLLEPRCSLSRSARGSSWRPQRYFWELRW